MGQPIPFNPNCPPVSTQPSNWAIAMETIETQQRTIRFLLANWNALLQQVTSYGAPTTLNQNAIIPSGFWQCLNPTTGSIATIVIAGVSTTINAPGPFTSDGTAIVTHSPSIQIVPVNIASLPPGIVCP